MTRKQWRLKKKVDKLKEREFIYVAKISDKVIRCNTKLLATYDTVKRQNNRLDIVSLKGKYGLFDSRGMIEYLELYYDFIADFQDNGVARTKLEGKWGLIDYDIVILKPTYDWISKFIYDPKEEKDIAYVFIGEEVSLIDKEGKSVLVSNHSTQELIDYLRLRKEEENHDN